MSSCVMEGKKTNGVSISHLKDPPTSMNSTTPRAPLALAAARLASVNFGAKSRTAGLVLTKSGALSTRSARACRFATWPDALVID